MSLITVPVMEGLENRVFMSASLPTTLLAAPLMAPAVTLARPYANIKGNFKGKVHASLGGYFANTDSLRMSITSQSGSRFAGRLTGGGYDFYICGTINTNNKITINQNYGSNTATGSYDGSRIAKGRYDRASHRFTGTITGYFGVYSAGGNYTMTKR